jgi:cyanobactin maturation PatA/PatG family protease
MIIADHKELWAETLGDHHICIAVLDGPVDQSHPSLATADLTHLETLTSGMVGRGPAAQHGTHITSVIFGQHNGSIKGIAPRCRGLIVPIFKDGPDGSIAPCSQLDLARAIIQAVQAGAHIINISGGELTPSGTAHPILADAVQTCAANNILIVAAAGNDGCECLHVPGALPSVLAVGAMNSHGLPLETNNWGGNYQAQGILAPGENILGASLDGGTVTNGGTSFATSIVSGVAALLLSLQIKLGQEPNPQAIRDFLLQSAYACDPQSLADCRPFMVGSLNASGALKLVKQSPVDHPLEKTIEARPTEVSMGNRQSTLVGGQDRPKIGDAAPDFSLKDHTGRDVRLRDYRGKNVALWFYPRADTPG